VWSLEDDLQGMNLSLHVEVFEGDDDDERFEIARGEADEGGVDRVSRRSDAMLDIPAGRFIPDFLACGDSIFLLLFFFFFFSVKSK
jgi:hypothetical protein